MPLSVGTRLESYEVTAPLGAGGMGEVYRAKDAKLGREVAIKILPEAFTLDVERRGRFEREARVLASLNHPGIGTLHDIQEADGKLFLVMELVEGETLAERIRRGPVPLEEAVALFVQIADALEAAHDKGIVHRDLKPANVKITPDGRAKILDFGLAKAFAADDGQPLESSLSPTLTRGTALGTILGTAAYMSPEQARGMAVDKRADVWAFGCCLYEAVTARKPFEGETVTDILAAVVKTEPDWSKPPAPLRPLLRRCLAKDPRRRLKDVADARLELQEPVDVVADKGPSRRVGAIVPWIVAAAALVSAIALFVSSRAPLPNEPVRTFNVHLPDALRSNGAPAISPDGERVVFGAIDASARPALWLRSFDSLEIRKLPGTEGADFPFWSPDGRHVGFFAGRELRVVDLTGAPPRSLCDVADPGGRGGTWSQDGVILFSAGNAGLMRVAETGGPVEIVTALDEGRRENSHRWPWFLPDGEHFLFTARSELGEHSIAVGSLSGGEPIRLLNAFSSVAYANGHLLYARDERLLAQPFDLTRLALDGDPVSLVEGVGTGVLIGLGYFSAASNDVLAYESGSEQRSLAWFDATGKQYEGPALEGVANPFMVSIAPDGRTAAFVLPDVALGSSDIWSYDFSRGIAQRLTLDPDWDQYPVWSPDGRRIAYRSTADSSVHVLDLEGKEPTRKLLQGKTVVPDDWSPDGRFLIYHEAGDLFAQPFKDGDPVPLADSPFEETAGHVSPDGRVLAYVTDETGRDEIWVTPFLSEGRRERVSNDGGTAPRWSPDGATLYYVSPNREVVAVPMSDRDRITPGAPRVLFEVPVEYVYLSWDVLRDGGFVVLASSGLRSDWTVVWNWTAGLAR